VISPDVPLKQLYHGGRLADAHPGVFGGRRGLETLGRTALAFCRAAEDNAAVNSLWAVGCAMTIRFSCPGCGAVFQATDARAGQKTNCTVCGQRLQLPELPNRTVLAPLVGHVPEGQPGRPARPPVTSPAPLAQVVSSVPVAQPAPPFRAQPQPLAPLPEPPPIIDPARVRRPRRGPWVPVVVVLLSLGALALGLRLLLTGGYLRSAVRTAEKRSHTRTDEEALVKTFIMNNTPDEDAARVRFTVWGPHLDNAEMRQLLDEAGVAEVSDLFDGEKFAEEELRQFRLDAFRAIIRVCYSASGKSRDELYLVAGKFVILLGENDAGDDWKREARKELSKVFPGVKRDDRPGAKPVSPTEGRVGPAAPAKRPEEKLVEAYLREKFPDCPKLRVLKWGPHDLQGELHAMAAQGIEEWDANPPRGVMPPIPTVRYFGEWMRIRFTKAEERLRKSPRDSPIKVVRARYYLRSYGVMPYCPDALFWIQDGKVFAPSLEQGDDGTNERGSLWLEYARLEVRRDNRPIGVSRLEAEEEYRKGIEALRRRR
jgi:hypothetical protein